MPDMREITRAELWGRIEGGERIILIEALGHDFYADAHLPTAVNVQPGDTGRLQQHVSADLDTPVVVYGATSSSHAHAVATEATALGCRDVSVYVAGKEDWVEAGLPVERL